MNIIDRFWNKVNKTNSCWLWIACRNEQGYGNFRLNGKIVKAHRVSWEESNGPILGGLSVLHKCDNPPCVNPEHLFLGTQQDNVKDRDKKGHWRPGYLYEKGSKNKKAKLTENEVLEIKQIINTHTITFLAKKFSVSRATIYDIAKKRTWTHV